MRFLAFSTAALAAFPFALATVSKEIYDPKEFPNKFERIQDELAEAPHRDTRFHHVNTFRFRPLTGKNHRRESADEEELPSLEELFKVPEGMELPGYRKPEGHIKEHPAITKIKKLTPINYGNVKQQKDDPLKHRKLCPKCGKQNQHKPCHKKHDPHKPCQKKHDHKIHRLHDHHDLGRKHGHDKNKHETHYKHAHEKQNNHKDLTAKCICGRLHHLAHKADHLFDYVKDIKCGNGDRECWEPVRKALYELEWKLDLFDRAIDKSNLDKCFSEEEETHIARCYCRYAEALIRLLEEISRKLEHIEGRTAYFIVTAVNSLRAADYAFVYELGRRLQREKIQVEIFRKEGATDGSTPHSIRKAFARFVSTPYITGEDFRVEDYHKEPKEKELKIIDEIKNKFKHKGHHHPHHHKDHKGHHHPHHLKDHRHHDKHCHHHRPHHKDHVHRIYHHKDHDHHRHHHKDHDHRRHHDHDRHRHHHHHKDHDHHCLHHKDHNHHRHHHKGHDDDREKEKVRIKVEDHGDRAQ
ncbi:unnamed protein product [Clonostachys chloroleuca]|uniref:Uncharacterized protein n=1 Tax=Clonostachys chloroleuca TaxID=1926264 RepID=A0AA35VCV1_9HYPO|nr:unnamed protein product [Clonostachys chloroleuca]